MAAQSTDKFKLASNGSRPSPTTLTALKSIGASSITVGALTGWPTTTGVDFCIYTIDTSGNKVAGSQTDWSGTASGTTISNLTLRAGTDNGYAVGAIVEAGPVAAWADDIVSGINVEHDQDGTHGAITAASVASAGAISGTTITGTAITASANLSMTGGTFSISGTYDGWIGSTSTWVYVSATSFKITGSDVTALFPVGTKIKLTQTTAKYFYVTAASFSTDTTVTVTGGSDYTLANAAITAPYFSNAATPQGFPQWFNWAPTYTNMTATSGTTVASFSMSGKTVNFRINFTFGASSAMGTAPNFTFPVTAVGYAGPSNTPIGGLRVWDASGGEYIGSVYWLTTTTAIIQAFDAAATTLRPTNLSSTNPMTWTTSDGWLASGTYQAA